MEYSGNSNLKQFINSYKNKNFLIEEETIINIIKQLCLALDEIHKNNIIHDNLNPENIFVNENNKIKIDPLSVSKRLKKANNYDKNISEKFKNYIPENINEINSNNNKVDIFSFGCIIYELFTLNEYHLDNTIDNKKGKIDLAKYNSKWQKLIDLILNNNYDKIPTAEEIYNYIENIVLYKEYDKTGKLIYEGGYIKGKRNGKGKEYSLLNGQLIYEGEFLNGKWNGKGKKYQDNGKLDYDGEYINNK